MDSSGLIKILISIDGGILVSIIIYGYKIVTFFNDLKFKTDIMWRDYEDRMDANKLHYHKRLSDLQALEE